MENKIDLFERLVRFLAIKPIEDAPFCFDRAKEIIKDENKESITFIADHGYFEDVLNSVEQRVGNLRPENGVLFLFIKGDESKKVVEKNLLSIVLYVNKIYIVGKAEDWRFNDPKISFLNIESVLADNHQRFLIFNSPSYNVALTARQVDCSTGHHIEAALTNDKEAVAYLNQLLAPYAYRKQI